MSANGTVEGMRAASLVLGYLFGAQFENGEEYFQTPEDISQLPNPRGSAYYDLCEHNTDTGDTLVWTDGRARARTDLTIFQLESDSFRYLVDLRDGHFEIQSGAGRKLKGATFFIKTPPLGAKLHLLYYRTRRHHFNAAGSIVSGLQIKNEISQECEYHFGWRAEVDGKFIDCTMFVV